MLPRTSGGFSTKPRSPLDTPAMSLNALAERERLHSFVGSARRKSVTVAQAGCANLLSTPVGRSYLRIELRVDRLVTTMERDVVLDDRTHPGALFAGRCVSVNVTVALGAKGAAQILAPFRADVGESQPRHSDPPFRFAQHPIHRATSWQSLHGAASVRAIAAKHNVSPSLVSLHLKLLRLSPEIQIYLRDLAAPRALHHFSLRRMAALAEFDHQRQMTEFAALKASFT